MGRRDQDLRITLCLAQVLTSQICQFKRFGLNIPIKNRAPPPPPKTQRPRLHESKTSNFLSSFLLLSENYESLADEIDPAEPEEDTDSVK